MPKPACVKCQCFYRPKRNDVRVLEAMPNGLAPRDLAPDLNIRGRRFPEYWQPYKLWAADLWECPDCGHELIAGWGGMPYLERHHPGFETHAEADPIFTINDC